MKIAFTILGCLWFGLFTIHAQNSTADALEKSRKSLNWQNKDLKSDKIPGASVEKTYRTLLKDLNIKDTIVVAVIDGGVDISHEELSGKIWVNADEIPANGIDDDHNGYTDDIHGWNFLGNHAGENIAYENYEIIRVLKTCNDSSEIFRKAELLYEEKVKKYKSDSTTIHAFESVFNQAKSIIRERTGIEVTGAEDLKKVKSGDKSVRASVKFLKSRYTNGVTEKLLEMFKENNEETARYYLNRDFNPRTLAGDNPEDINDRNYGNNDISGPNPDHGTAVAGIIASERNNNMGINGIATAVKIMPIRVVPDGDERDKDIALAIMYAVDNGARIVNMSFGKPLSPRKEFVDSAIRYAESHNVLLVHAAGNDGKDLESNDNFPSDIYADGSEAKNLICVGASSMKRDKTMAASFSNYGIQRVDLFAPGVDMTVLDSPNTYDIADGTSISAPVVSGIAAVILSVYPQLKPEQLIDVLIKGSAKFSTPVVIPGDIAGKDLIPFTNLSRSGGIANLYDSLLLAGKLINDY